MTLPIETTENVRHFDVTTYKVRQIIPATGYQAVYAQENGQWFASPVVAWGVLDERVQYRVAYKLNGRHHAEDDGESKTHRKVLALTLDYDTGELHPPHRADNFLGVIGIDDDPAYVFADELASYWEMHKTATTPTGGS